MQQGVNMPNIDPFLPDPHTYTIVINERMRRLLHAAVCEFVDNHVNDQDAEGDAAQAGQLADDAVLTAIEELLDPEAGPDLMLLPSPTVNSFVV
jgi:hypothetical protein